MDGRDMTTRVEVLGTCAARVAEAAASYSPAAEWEPGSAVLAVRHVTRNQAIQHAALMCARACRDRLGLRWDGVRAL